MNAHDVCRSTAAAALLFLGTGCGLPPPTRPPEPIPVTEDTVLLTVPVVPQGDDHECGLATLATLCGYHGGSTGAAVGIGLDPHVLWRRLWHQARFVKIKQRHRAPP